MPLSLTVMPHPLLDLRAFVTEFPAPLATMTTQQAVLDLFRPGASAPRTSDETVRQAVRRLLRHGGFRPAGRSKPASEYLVRAVSERRLQSINVAVDVCNAVSLHSGLPISVVDLEPLRPPLAVFVAPAGASYVFNAAGQTIDLSGLTVLADALGPCASPVKDSQRTKTCGQTRSTLSLVWGTVELPGRADQTAGWYHQLLALHGAQIDPVSW